jgi:hypothetical protein
MQTESGTVAAAQSHAAAKLKLHLSACRKSFRNKLMGAR